MGYIIIKLCDKTISINSKTDCEHHEIIWSECANFARKCKHIFTESMAGNKIYDTPKL